MGIFLQCVDIGGLHRIHFRDNGGMFFGSDVLQDVHPIIRIHHVQHHRRLGRFHIADDGAGLRRIHLCKDVGGGIGIEIFRHIRCRRAG